MTEKRNIAHLLTIMLKLGAPEVAKKPVSGLTNVARQALPQFAEVDVTNVEMISVRQPDGRLGVQTGDLIRVVSEIGYFIDMVWVTEGIKPGIIAMSHHLGRWRLQESMGVNPGMSNMAQLEEDSQGGHTLNILHGARAWQSFDPDTSRVWWQDVGVHQNLIHAVHPDPVSGAHCWLQAVTVHKAGPGDKHGDVWVDTNRSMEVYREWLAMTRPAADSSPDGTRRPLWLKRPLKPTVAAYRLPDHLDTETREKT